MSATRPSLVKGLALLRPISGLSVGELPRCGGTGILAKDDDRFRDSLRAVMYVSEPSCVEGSTGMDGSPQFLAPQDLLETERSSWQVRIIKTKIPRHHLEVRQNNPN